MHIMLCALAPYAPLHDWYDAPFPRYIDPEMGSVPVHMAGSFVCVHNVTSLKDSTAIGRPVTGSLMM